MHTRRLPSMVYLGCVTLAAAALAACGGGGGADDGPDAGGPDAGQGGDGDSVRDGGGDGDASGDGDAGVMDGAAGDGDGDGDSCAVTPAADGDAHLSIAASGTRIEARMLRSAGMPDVFYGFFDSQLGVECDFLPASDGVLRCLPRGAALSVMLGYVDPACEQRLVSGPSPCSGGGYVRQKDDCGDRFAVRPLEALATTVAVYRGTRSDCTAAGEDAMPAAGLHMAGAALDPTTFVEGRLEELPGACRAALRIVETADGARGPLEVIDAARGLSCGAVGAASVGACRPTQLAYPTPNLFSDAACTEAVQYASWPKDAQCQPPQVLAGDGNGAAYFEVAGVYEGDVYGGNPCEPAQNKPWIGALFEPGAAVAAESLPQLQSVAVGSGRLRAYRVAEAGVSLLASATDPGFGGFHDSVMGLDCTVFLFDDGVYRCVPTDSGPEIDGPLYDDDACTTPAVACPGDCPGKLFVSATLDDASCRTDSLANGVWEATAATGDELTYFDQGAGCQGVGLSGTEAWLADPVALDSLAALELVVAP